MSVDPDPPPPVTPRYKMAARTGRLLALDSDDLAKKYGTVISLMNEFHDLGQLTSLRFTSEWDLSQQISSLR